MKSPSSLASLVSLASLASLLASACSSPPTESFVIPRRDLVTPASDVTFPKGVTLGGPCDGAVYFIVLDGWALCADGAWAYTQTNPTDFGPYSLDNEYAGFDFSASASTSQESSSGDGGARSRSTSSTSTTSTAVETGTLSFTIGQGQG
jgi:hypothetical protein